MARSAEDIYDELLILRCQDGDADAMDELVARWQRRLLRYAWQLTGRQDAAWDVLQEAWLAIVRGIRGLDDPAHFRHWAYRLVGNKSADWVRRQQRQRKLVDDTADAGQQAAPSQNDEDADRLRHALDRLPADSRGILWLRYFQDMQLDGIARILHIPEGTVKSRLHHARNRLKRAFQRKGD